jgi:hypothetical protein
MLSGRTYAAYNAYVRGRGLDRDLFQRKACRECARRSLPRSQIAPPRITAVAPHFPPQPLPSGRPCAGPGGNLRMQRRRRVEGSRRIPAAAGVKPSKWLWAFALGSVQPKT